MGDPGVYGISRQHNRSAALRGRRTARRRPPHRGRHPFHARHHRRSRCCDLQPRRRVRQPCVRRRMEPRERQHVGIRALTPQRSSHPKRRRPALRPPDPHPHCGTGPVADPDRAVRRRPRPVRDKRPRRAASIGRDTYGAAPQTTRWTAGSARVVHHDSARRRCSVPSPGATPSVRACRGRLRPGRAGQHPRRDRRCRGVRLVRRRAWPAAVWAR